MCDYKTEYSNLKEDKLIGYKCKRRSTGKVDEEGKKYCIFHRKDEKKKDFYKRFKKLYLEGEHDFTGFVFPKDFSFTRLKEETGPLKFVDAVFVWTLFLCEVDFSWAEFSGEDETYFNGAKFSGNGKTNFSWAIFSGSGGKNFRGAEFSGKGGTSFGNAQFYGEGGISFSFAKFSDADGISFVRAKFLGEGETRFRFAEFSGESGVDFRWAEFLGKGVTCFGNAVFIGKGGTDFSWTKFSSTGGTDFSWTKFFGEGKVYFIGELFSNETEVDFRNVSFETPENVTFDGVNLSKCKFAGTDLEHVNIKEVFWKNKKKDSWWRPWRVKVYDDTIQTAIFKCGGEKNHYRVYQLYNQLLLNYERTYRHHEAGDFYAGQMDMRRRGNLDRKIFSQILLTLYKGIAEYGERPVRVLAWLLLVLFAFGLFYIGIGIEGTKGAADIVRSHFSPMAIFTGSFWSDYLQGIRLSLETMTLGKIEIFRTNYVTKYKDNPWVIFAKVFNVVSGASLLTLFLLSVRRRFRKP